MTQASDQPSASSTPAVPKAASTVLCVRDGDAGLDLGIVVRAVGGQAVHDLDDQLADLAELVEKLEAPRNIWVMVPAGKITDSVMSELQGLLAEGDLVIDGGNSRFSDDGPNAELLGTKGVGYLDCGVSGGIWGLDNGYGLMVGGAAENVERAMPIFDALRPEGEREDGAARAQHDGRRGRQPDGEPRLRRHRWPGGVPRR